MPNWVPQWLCLSLFGLGLLLNLRPVVEIIETFIEVGDGQAFATVLSGLVGFAGVILATVAGFRNLTKSQSETAQREREAREHQAELARQAAERDRKQEEDVLASALIAELSALYNRVHNMSIFLHGQGVIWENLAKDPEFKKESIELAVPKYQVPIFSANLHKLGLLGPSTAGDVVEVFAPTNMSELTSNRKVPVTAAAQLAKGLYEQHMKWRGEILHVQMRLLAVQGHRADPGTLFEFRREKERQSASPATTA